MSDIVEVVDHVSDAAVLTAAAHEDPTVADFLADCYRNEAAVTDAELERLHAAAVAAAGADGIDDARTVVGDLTLRRWNEITAMGPQDTGWSPEIVYHAGAEKPYQARLCRGTANGPDYVRLPSFYSAENALTAAVLHLINMKLAWDYGDAEAKDCMRRQIEYANRQA